MTYNKLWKVPGFQDNTPEEIIMDLFLKLSELRGDIHALEKRCDSLQNEIDNMRPKLDVNPNFCFLSPKGWHKFEKYIDVFCCIYCEKVREDQ